MRKSLVLGTLALAVAGSALAAVPASAACTQGDLACTSTTVAATSPVGSLTILASPVGTGGLTFTSAISGGSQTIDSAADLTLTTVTDTRLAGTGWSVTANMSPLTPVVAGPAAIPVSNLQLSVPAPTRLLGSANMVLGSKTSPTTPSGTGDILAFATASATGGLNTVSYTPHISITFPAGTPSGTAYTGTLTQSVA